MTATTSLLSSSHKAAGSHSTASHSKYVNVDSKNYEGSWSGTYPNKNKFTVTISHVTGFRAKAKYQSGSMVKYQDVLIKDKSFRIGDSKFTLIKPGIAQIKTAITNPVTGNINLETANAVHS